MKLNGEDPRPFEIVAIVVLLGTVAYLAFQLSRSWLHRGW